MAQQLTLPINRAREDLQRIVPFSGQIRASRPLGISPDHASPTNPRAGRDLERASSGDFAVELALHAGAVVECEQALETRAGTDDAGQLAHGARIADAIRWSSAALEKSISIRPPPFPS